MLVVAEVLVVVTLQSGCPAYGLRLLLAQLAAVRHLGLTVTVGIQLATAQACGIEGVLAPPALDVGVLHVGREHTVEEQVLGGLVAQVQRGRDGIGLLGHQRVVELIQDAEVVIAHAAALQVLVVRPVAVIGGYGAAGVVGIVYGVVVVLGILPLVEVAVDVDLQLELARQVHVNLRHGGIAAVGGGIDDVVLVGIAYGGVVAHALGTAGDADGVVVRERVVAEYVKPVGVHGLHTADLALKLLLGVGAGIEVGQCLLIAHLGHARRVAVVLVYEVLRELYALGRVHQVNLRVGIVGTLAEGVLPGVRHDGLALAAALRGHHNDTIGGTGAVEGRGGGVLQHVDALDVLRVDAGDGVAYAVHVVGVVQHIGRQVYRVCQDDAVDHPQRLAVAYQRRRAADAYLARGVDLA